MLEVAQKYLQLKSGEYYKCFGKVDKVVGLTIESIGPKAKLNDLCMIFLDKERRDYVMSEVVGFKDSHIILMPFDNVEGVGVGCIVENTGHPLTVAVGDELLGHTVDGIGRVTDCDEKDLELDSEYPIEAPPPDPMSREIISDVLPLGVKAVDGLITVGKGQRIGIFAGSGVGKSTLLGMFARNTKADINVIALIGERGREVREFIERDLGPEGMARSVVVVATSDKPALIRNKAAKTATPAPAAPKVAEQTSDIEQEIKELDSIAKMMESTFDKPQKNEPSKPQSAQELKFVRILYKTLLDNEVDEKYINQILDEIEKFLRPGNSLDVILSNVYQKLVLRFGQPETIKVNGKKPRVVFFVGPTGVGKTTTIAKIASKFKVNYNKNIAFITADTYRIAATDQLRTFANILDTPLSVIYTATELNSAVAEYEQADVIFVDTAGFSHKNETQRNDMRALLAGLSPEYEKSVYLVLSATTKYRDLISIIDSYKDIADYKLIFTKLDETSSYGNLLNIKLYSDAGISYVTNGQNVPDDIEVFDTQKIVKQLLGGRQ